MNLVASIHVIRAMVKSVCVVGAGPSGLVAAKTLLHNSPPGSFTVAVYDSQHAIGGLWPASRTDNGRAVHPLMVANQSKHTMLFSEMGWEPDAPQFPRAWMVGRYLERYCERYLQGRPDFELGLGKTVTKAERVGEGEGWVVEIGSERRRFDCLVVASGYFGKPMVPPCFFDNNNAASSVPVVHSSQYRDLEGLLAKSPRKGGKILVVGGQISGVEIAGTIAGHLSSAIHSPGAPSSLPNVEKYSIHHVIQRPTWIVPHFTTPEPSSSAPPFLPVDLVTWDLGRRRREGVLRDTSGYISEEAAAMLHDKFEAAVGEQSDFCALLQPNERERLQPPYIAASDWYAEFVRAGVITLSKGSVAAFHSKDGIATLSRGGSKIDDIAAVVLATGFDPSPCISFLPEEVLQTLHHAPEFTSQPLALAFHGSHHPDVPNLGFVGFYRGPFWGVMQMQARLLAKLWSEGPSDRMVRAFEADDSIERTLRLRGDPRLSQFPQGDYLFLMQDYAAALGIPLQPSPPSDRPELEDSQYALDPVTPARYISPYDDVQAKKEAGASLTEVRDLTVQALTTPRFVAHAVFRSLLGRWRLSRRLTSRLPSQPSGTFTGTAEFHLRSQTSDGMQCLASGNHTGHDLESADGLEYLYIESGEFKTESGFGFQATRRYIWRYDEGRDVMSVWFARTDDDKRADYLFHEVEFIPRAADADADAEAREEQGWRAQAGHLCVEDYYDVKYGFWFKAVGLKRWGIEYTVKGPRKDYTIDGSYERI